MPLKHYWSVFNFTKFAFAFSEVTEDVIPSAKPTTKPATNRHGRTPAVSLLSGASSQFAQSSDLPTQSPLRAALMAPRAPVPVASSFLGSKQPIMSKSKSGANLVQIFMCERCHSYFPNANSLAMHVLQSHSNIQPTQPVQPPAKPKSQSSRLPTILSRSQASQPQLQQPETTPVQQETPASQQYIVDAQGNLVPLQATPPASNGGNYVLYEGQNVGQNSQLVLQGDGSAYIPGQGQLVVSDPNDENQQWVVNQQDLGQYLLTDNQTAEGSQEVEWVVESIEEPATSEPSESYVANSNASTVYYTDPAESDAVPGEYYTTTSASEYYTEAPVTAVSNTTTTQEYYSAENLQATTMAQEYSTMKPEPGQSQEGGLQDANFEALGSNVKVEGEQGYNLQLKTENSENMQEGSTELGFRIDNVVGQSDQQFQLCKSEQAEQENMVIGTQDNAISAEQGSVVTTAQDTMATEQSAVVSGDQGNIMASKQTVMALAEPDMTTADPGNMSAVDPNNMVSIEQRLVTTQHQRMMTDQQNIVSTEQQSLVSTTQEGEDSMVSAEQGSVPEEQQSMITADKQSSIVTAAQENVTASTSIASAAQNMETTAQNFVSSEQANLSTQLQEQYTTSQSLGEQQVQQLLQDAMSVQGLQNLVEANVATKMSSEPADMDVVMTGALNQDSNSQTSQQDVFAAQPSASASAFASAGDTMQITSASGSSGEMETSLTQMTAGLESGGGPGDEANDGESLPQLGDVQLPANQALHGESSDTSDQPSDPFSLPDSVLGNQAPVQQEHAGGVAEPGLNEQIAADLQQMVSQEQIPSTSSAQPTSTELLQTPQTLVDSGTPVTQPSQDEEQQSVMAAFQEQAAQIQQEIHAESSQASQLHPTSMDHETSGSLQQMAGDSQDLHQAEQLQGFQQGVQQATEFQPDALPMAQDDTGLSEAAQLGQMAEFQQQGPKIEQGLDAAEIKQEQAASQVEQALQEQLYQPAQTEYAQDPAQQQWASDALPQGDMLAGDNQSQEVAFQPSEQAIQESQFEGEQPAPQEEQVVMQVEVPAGHTLVQFDGNIDPTILQHAVSQINGPNGELYLVVPENILYSTEPQK